MAKVDVRTPDMPDWGHQIGAAIEDAVRQVWESKKVAAAEIGVDDAEFGKWLSGNRRPQFDRLFAVERLRKPLVKSLAKIAGGRVLERIEWDAA